MLHIDMHAPWLLSDNFKAMVRQFLSAFPGTSLASLKNGSLDASYVMVSSVMSTAIQSWNGIGETS